MKKIIIGFIIGYIVCLITQSVVAQMNFANLSTERIFNAVFDSSGNTLRIN